MRSPFFIALAFLSPLFLPAPLPAIEEVKASHILLRNQDEADLVRNEIVEKGGDRKAFMEAARKHSKDVTTKRAGGALGWFTRQKMVREFSETAFDLNQGEISQPVKSQYGWHLILLEDRRDQQGGAGAEAGAHNPNDGEDHSGHAHAQPQGTKKASDTTAIAPGVQPKSSPPVPGAGPKAPAATPGKNSAGPTPASSPGQAPEAVTPPITPGAGAPGAGTPGVEAAKVQPQKPRLPARALKLTLEVKERFRRPEQTVEVDLTLSNPGEEAQKVLAPDLLPLGFTVTGEVAPTAPPATWDELKARKPEAPILTLGSRKSIGGTFSLNDCFKDLPPNGRYRLSWTPQAFFQNLRMAFPDIALLPDFAAVEAAYNDPRVLRREVTPLPGRLHSRSFQPEVVFSILEPITGAAGKKYYAGIELERQSQMIWVELYPDRQPDGVRQFAKLALEGFYDGLSLFDIQKGNHIRAGCPRNNGTGAPEGVVFAQNAQKVPHEKGTISLVTRATRTGSKEVGSIFFVCRKPHPEWDEDHVPIGKIVQGEEVLDRVESTPGMVFIRRISVVAGDKAPPEVSGIPSAPSIQPPPGPDGKPIPPQAPPVAKIKTPKGELTVELFEVDAPNTVANFIELTEKGFFNPDPQMKKEMTFYYAVPGTVLITGSPTNDPSEAPPHRIHNEAADNKRTHEKGTLTMLLERDPQSGNPIPDTAGSQFMVCLQDIPSWNGIYTPFGKVIGGQEVLEKLAQGDKVESVSIASKRNRPYPLRKLPAK